MPITGQFLTNISLSGLDGNNGFELDGISPQDYTGSHVNGIGDINGDGIQDLAIVGVAAGSGGGIIYVLFGKKSVWNNPILLSSINGANGFRLMGTPKDGSGAAIVGTDLNNDGISDLAIGATGVGLGTGKVFVIFGKTTPWSSIIVVSGVDGVNGFEIVGEGSKDSIGDVLASADINGDNIPDLIIGAPRASNAGKTYVVFGKTSLWSTSFLLASLNGTNGFVLSDVSSGDTKSHTVASTDINGDGISDVVIGATTANYYGKIYVVFGKRSPWNSLVQLSSLNGTNGFVLDGKRSEQIGYVIASGDINGDTILDLVMGVNGKTYVLFGKRSPWSTPISLYSLDGSNGFELDSVNVNDYSFPCQVTSADVNGDGISDIISALANPTNAGKAYVVFGKRSAWSTPISFSAVNGVSGFALVEVCRSYSLGSTDINDDGVSDLILGDREASSYTGRAYVVLGEDIKRYVLFNNLIIHAGETLTLSSEYLNTARPRNLGDTLFTIRNVEHGIFQYYNKPDVAITTFTQQAAWNGEVQLVHDSSKFPLSYDIQAQFVPSFIYIPFQSANVTFVPATPRFICNQLNIMRGETVYLTTNNLQAKKVGVPNDGEFQFIISNLVQGEFLNYLEKPVLNFTQQMVRDGVIQFAHDGSPHAPHYSVSVCDGEITTPAFSASITFNAHPPTVAPSLQPVPPDHHTNLIRNAIISAAVSGGVGLGFFALRLYIQHKAAKNLKKVLEGDPSATERDQKEYHEHVIRPIATQVFENIKTTGCLGMRGKQESQEYLRGIANIIGTLANQGAKIDLRQLEPHNCVLIVNEIIKQIRTHCVKRSCVTRFFNCSPDITPLTLEAKKDEIVTGVCAALPRTFFSEEIRRAGPANSGVQSGRKEEMDSDDEADQLEARVRQPILRGGIQSDEKENKEALDDGYRVLSARPA